MGTACQLDTFEAVKTLIMCHEIYVPPQMASIPSMPDEVKPVPFVPSRALLTSSNISSDKTRTGHLQWNKDVDRRPVRCHLLKHSSLRHSGQKTSSWFAERGIGLRRFRSWPGPKCPLAGIRQQQHDRDWEPGCRALRFDRDNRQALPLPQTSNRNNHHQARALVANSHPASIHISPCAQETWAL